MSFSWDPTGTGATGGHEPVLPARTGSSSSGLVVRGGVNGIAWSLTELDAAATAVQGIAEAVCRISAALARVDADLWGLPPSAVIAATAAHSACSASQLAAGYLGTSLVECAGDVRAARAQYERSELFAVAAVAAVHRGEATALRLVAGSVLPIAGPAAPVGLSVWLASLALRGETGGYRDLVEAELATLPLVIDPAAAPMAVTGIDAVLRATGHATGFASFLAVTALAVGRHTGLSTAGDLTIRPVGAPRQAQAEPLTLGDVTDHVAEAQHALETADGHPHGASPGGTGQDGAGRDRTASAGSTPGSAVTVRRYDGGAAPVWEVDIPGTSDWHLTDSSDLFDLEGNGEAITAADDTGTTVRPTQVGALVSGALVAAGAPRGARVVLVGHSQGGIHAAALAADPLFRSRYDVRQVITAGAPIAGFTVPQSTNVLSLEHRDDIVPALDGRPNPDARNRVTVTGERPPASLAARSSPGAAGTSAATPWARIGAAHQLETYRGIAREADASNDPSITAQRNVLADLTRRVDRQTVWVFEGRDPPSADAAAAPSSSDAVTRRRIADGAADRSAAANRSGGRPPR